MHRANGWCAGRQRLSAFAARLGVGLIALLVGPALAHAQLSGTKTVSGNRSEGGAITYTIVLTNTHGSLPQDDNDGNEFSDVLPFGLVVVGADATSGTATADPDSGTVNWNGSIPAGASVTITITAAVDQGTVGQILSNQGTINYDADHDSSNESTTVTDDPSVVGVADPTSFTVLPPVTLSPSTLPAIVVNAAVSQQFTATGGAGAPFTYTVTDGALPTGLTLNPSTGLVSGSPTAAGSFLFTLTASDTSGGGGSALYLWQVLPPVVVSPTTSTLPTRTVGSVPNVTFTATGGSGTGFTFAVTSGLLPTGLTLTSSTGVVAGAPTTAGTFSFTVTAAATGGATGSRAYSWQILPAVTFMPTTLPAIRVDAPQAVEFAPTGGTGSGYTFAVTAGALAPGFTLNGTTGTLVMNPIAPGPYSFTITATDSGGFTGSQAYSGTIGPSVVLTYVLPEGAVTTFFTEDVSIANPTGTPAPLVVFYLPEHAAPFQDLPTIPPNSRVTLDLGTRVGAGGALSVRVLSLEGVPLAVERTMFWDSTSYGGHTETAVTAPATRWYFAEGAQGFFETFLLLISPNAIAADVTLTFLLENAPPVTKTVSIPSGQTRLTVPIATIPELANRSFGIIVDSTQPIAVERAMYFGSGPSRPWAGGHDSAGVTAPSTTWYLAEAATGTLFDTFILMMNPQLTQATVMLRYLLPSGETTEVEKIVPPQGRLTVNVETESDPRLQHASVSVQATANVPIVLERSMYWQTAEGGPPWTEAHNSFGATVAAPRWALAEGRSGGALNFRTYILLANPGTTPAQVQVRYLLETGAPITRTYSVAASSRFTVDVSADVPELDGQRFAAAIATTGDVPIVVERSLYWDGAGITWSGGSNALGTRLP